MKYFIDLNFNFSEHTFGETELVCLVEEESDCIHLTLPVLCNYFEPEILTGALKKWPVKKFTFKYDNSLALDYKTFRVFKKIVYDNEDPNNYN